MAVLSVLLIHSETVILLAFAAASTALMASGEKRTGTIRPLAVHRRCLSKRSRFPDLAPATPLHERREVGRWLRPAPDSGRLRSTLAHMALAGELSPLHASLWPPDLGFAYSCHQDYYWRPTRATSPMARFSAHTTSPPARAELPRLASLKSTRFNSPANNVGPGPASLDVVNRGVQYRVLDASTLTLASRSN
jgi:hypothetical protein